MTAADDLVARADGAYESLRALNHATIWSGQEVLPPTAYRLLGNLTTAGGHGLAQLLGQLADRLDESAARDDLYDALGGRPSESVAKATSLLREAATLAAHAGKLLDGAQSAIASVGVRDAG